MSEIDEVATLPLRERRRAQTVAEIKQAALDRLAEGGHAALSLRAVARDVGVSVQALYHYFDSRDALLTALITDAYLSLTDAVAVGAGDPEAPPRQRILGAALAYRDWAQRHRAEFMLALGVPLRGYAAPECGPTTEAAIRMGLAFRDVVFGDWSTEELHAVRLPDASVLAAELGAHDEKGLPPGAYALFLSGWSTLHGFVTLEIHGHLPWVAEGGEELCRVAMSYFVDALEVTRARAH